MYAITEGLAKVNGKTVETFEREISEGRVALQVEAGTTGYTGESTREAGGRTLLCFTCICGDFHLESVENDQGQMVGVKIACCGDDGLNAILKALDFSLTALDDQRCEVND